MLKSYNDNDQPRQSEQPSQEPVHVHFFFHGSLLRAHHCLHTVLIANQVDVSRRIIESQRIALACSVRLSTRGDGGNSVCRRNYMWRWRSRNANDESSRGVVELAVDDAATCRLIIHSCDADATADNDNDSPRQLEQPSQEPVHVHFFFHGSLLAAHHCFLHPAMIAKEV